MGEDSKPQDDPASMPMSAPPIKSTKRGLDPLDRVSETLFGLIMVLTFTGSLNLVTEIGSDDVHTMLVGALSCNLAWGIIDALFYLMGSLAEKSRNLMIYKTVRYSTDSELVQRLISDALPSVVAAVLKPDELEAIRQRLKKLPAPSPRVRLHKEDLLAAFGVFLWVNLSTFPVAIPFIVMPDVLPALRVSNGIAVALLFAMGCISGHLTGRRPWLMGIIMVILGGLCVALTIALGG